MVARVSTIYLVRGDESPVIPQLGHGVLHLVLSRIGLARESDEFERYPVADDGFRP